MKKKPEQTTSGVKFQGTLLLSLAAAMVIAGGTAIVMQWQGVESADLFQQEKVQNETTEDTEQHQAEPVPADSGASSVDSGTVPAPVATEEEWLIPPAKDTVMAGCVLSTYDDGGFIVVGIPKENK